MPGPSAVEGTRIRPGESIPMSSASGIPGWYLAVTEWMASKGITYRAHANTWRRILFSFFVSSCFSCLIFNKTRHFGQHFESRSICACLPGLREDMMSLRGDAAGEVDVETICNVIRNADAEFVDFSFQTNILHEAVRSGSLPIVQALLQAKNTHAWKDDLRCYGDYRAIPSAFMVACEKPENVALVKEFLKDSRITTKSCMLRGKHSRMPEVYQELMYCHPSLVKVLADENYSHPPLYPHGKVDVNQKIGGMGILHRYIRDFQDRLRKYMTFYFVTTAIRFPSVSFECYDFVNSYFQVWMTTQIHQAYAIFSTV